MRSVTFLAIGLPLLVGAQDYPWLKDPNWKPTNGWGAPASGWGNVDYSGGSNAGSQAPAAANNQPVVPTQQPSSSSVYVPSPSSTGDAVGQTTTTTPPAAMPTSPAAPAPSTTATSTTASSSDSANGNTGPSGSTCSSGQQSIEITNKSHQELVLLAGVPWTTGQCSNIAVDATCTICQERGQTGGNLQVGYGKANSQSTWIEGNWDTTAEFPCVDISYIPGYTVPILCTGADGSSTIGTSDPLCTDEACTNCDQKGGTYKDGSCVNPMGDPATVLVDGPAPEFFSSAANIVYTYPNNHHVGNAPAWSSFKCVAHPQFGGPSKRAIEAPKVEEKRDEAAALAHSHLAKRHRRHLHRHVIQGGSKI